MRRRGIYVEMAHHPQVILDSLERVEKAVHLATIRQRLGCIVPAALLALGGLGFILLILLQPEGMGLFFVAFAAWMTGIILLIALRRGEAPLLQEHFEAARQILYTLRDDTGRKGLVVGWLDLGGPQQKEKTVRTARSGGGKRKVYYRDPWFKVKFKLVDGNVLRLTLEDKVKTKAGAIARHQSQLSAKLVVNPNLYHLGAVPSGEIPLAGAALLSEDGTFLVKAAGSAQDLSAGQVLEMLKRVYNYLEPIEPGLAINTSEL